MRLSPSAPSEVDVPPSPKRVVRARLGSASTDSYFGEGGGGSYPQGREGVRLGEFLVFVAQGVVGARSGSFGSCCDRGPNRRVQLSPDHSLDPAKKGEKEGVGGGGICQGGRYQVHLVEGNPRKGVPASAISGVSARGPPRPLACISTRVRFRSQV